MAIITFLSRKRVANCTLRGSSTRGRSSHVRLWILVALVSLLGPIFLLVPFRFDLHETQLRIFPESAPLNVVSLIYGQSTEHRNIEHNCAMISKTRHRFIVYTNDLTQAYCRVCDCELFTKRDCPCPGGEGACGVKNPCEKLLFFIDALQQYREMVFLDTDLLILEDFFLDRLAARAKAHDFLATYGHTGIMFPRVYTRNFNSGLLFIRWLPGLNYTKMKDVMYTSQSRNDQGIISEFVQNNYRNWDTLSWKWHCRGLKSLEQDIPPEECYTIHDRNEVEDVLKQLNKKRLTLHMSNKSGHDVHRLLSSKMEGFVLTGGVH